MGRKHKLSPFLFVQEKLASNNILIRFAFLNGKEMKLNLQGTGLLLVLASVLCMFTACKQEKTEQEIMRDDITAKEAELFKDKTEAIDKDKAIEMVRMYADYADKYSTDSLAPEYLFRAAEISENAGQPNNAITYLTRIEENYKDYANYPISIFKKAYIYENSLKNQDKARKYYEQFVADYPDHELAEAASSSLIFLGMSDQELIRVLEKLSK